jgi:hypothetical protein
VGWGRCTGATTHGSNEVLARHLEQNVLGDRYSEGSFVVEKRAHLQLIEPKLAIRHIESVVAELTGKIG